VANYLFDSIRGIEKMRLIDVFHRIQQLELNIFSTSDIASYLNIPLSYASKLLQRLTKANHLVKIKRGLWAFPDRLDPLALPNYLLAPYPAYISLQSALYYHNVIDQIPAVVYAVTLHKTTVIKTPVAVISAHQIKPGFFFGYDYDEIAGVKMATAEKALIDLLYLTPAKSKLFANLPEIDLDVIDIKKIKEIVKKVPSASRRKIIQKVLKKKWDIEVN